MLVLPQMDQIPCTSQLSGIEGDMGVCPYCSAELSLGLIESGYAIYLSSSLNKPGIIPPYLRKEARDISYCKLYHYIPVERCPNCNVVIIRLEE